MLCDRAGSSCTNSRFPFHCVQDRAKLEVVYVDRREEGLMVRSHRNITINIGCTCLAPKMRLLDFIRTGVKD